MRSPILVSTLVLALSACAAGPQASPATPGPTPTQAAAGVPAACEGKVDANLLQALTAPAVQGESGFAVEVAFSAQPSASELERMALLAAPPSGAVGQVQRGTVATLCAEPTVTQIKLQPQPAPL